MYASTPGLLATWALLTLGVYCALKPLSGPFPPTMSDRRVAQPLRRISGLVVVGMYGFLVFWLGVVFITT